jgi:hypothetical protein
LPQFSGQAFLLPNKYCGLISLDAVVWAGAALFKLQA